MSTHTHAEIMNNKEGGGGYRLNVVLFIFICILGYVNILDLLAIYIILRKHVYIYVYHPHSNFILYSKS